MNKLSLQTVLTVLPVLSAALYLLGATYFEGYLEGFGVDSPLFTLSIDRSLYIGFFSIVNFGLVPMAYTFLAIPGLLFIIGFAALISSTTEAKRLQEFLQKYRDSKKDPQQKSAAAKPPGILLWLADKSTDLSIYVGGIFILLVVILLMALLSQNAGQKQAQREIKDFENKTGAQVFVYETSKSTPVRAKQITCGSSHCAFWVGTGSVVIKHEDISRVTAHAQPLK
ncbi:hypothetical protein ACIQW9_07220 [Herminiimonas sp. NPDC097707]|uniref:hypothetical protein n=1 Tax=Herminiimonas sp. NPDC097707 TaxID=3364007 RepID=UPI00383AE1A0